jgi:hypothetical protein
MEVQARPPPRVPGARVPEHALGARLALAVEAEQRLDLHLLRLELDDGRVHIDPLLLIVYRKPF